MNIALRVRNSLSLFLSDKGVGRWPCFQFSTGADCVRVWEECRHDAASLENWSKLPTAAIRKFSKIPKKRIGGLGLFKGSGFSFSPKRVWNVAPYSVSLKCGFHPGLWEFSHAAVSLENNGGAQSQ